MSNEKNRKHDDMGDECFTTIRGPEGEFRSKLSPKMQSTTSTKTEAQPRTAGSPSPAGSAGLQRDGDSNTQRYEVIYADPPWRYGNATPNRRIENHYPTMMLATICCMEIPAARDAVLYMWATAPLLMEAFAVIRSWGFCYKSHAVWDKEILGMGYWFRGQHELLMVATRGRVSPPMPELRISSVIRCERGAHSAKPEYVRAMIEKWFPHAKRLELFSRLKRPGWDVYGNQVEHDLLSGSSDADFGVTAHALPSHPEAAEKYNGGDKVRR